MKRCWQIDKSPLSCVNCKQTCVCDNHVMSSHSWTVCVCEIFIVHDSGKYRKCLSETRMLSFIGSLWWKQWNDLSVVWRFKHPAQQFPCVTCTCCAAAVNCKCHLGIRCHYDAFCSSEPSARCFLLSLSLFHHCETKQNATWRSDTIIITSC